jgi:dihydrofolate reductase
MAKLIYTVLMSLDGYVADKNGNFDWAEPDEEVHSFVNELARDDGTYLYGRRMYEVMAVWQTLPTHDQPSFIADFVNIWRAADKVVYSKNLKAASTPRTRIEQHFEPEAVQRMKASATQDLAIGGPTLAAHAFQGWPGRRLSLVHCDAALLGMVLVLSRAASPLSWALQGERRFRNGMVYLHYQSTRSQGV